jgi:hypothetical protein
MGFFIVFQVDQLAIKEEMKNNISCGLKDERVTVLKIDNKLLTSANSVFEQKDDEFTYNGSKYDIVKEETGTIFTTFYAVNDAKENHLFASLDNHIQSNTDLPNKHSQNSKNLTKSILKIFFTERTAYLIPSFCSESELISPTIIYKSADQKAALLPPKLA